MDFRQLILQHHLIGFSFVVITTKTVKLTTELWYCLSKLVRTFDDLGSRSQTLFKRQAARH